MKKKALIILKIGLVLIIVMVLYTLLSGGTCDGDIIRAISCNGPFSKSSPCCLE